MSKGKRYTHEFKVEAVKQITERGYSSADVAERLGISSNSLQEQTPAITPDSSRVSI